MNKTTVFDVAKYILQKKGSLSAMRLQKLIYYSQAWSLVWDDTPLFDSIIEAWANGPVCRELFEKHRGCYLVSLEGISEYATGCLTETQMETIDAILTAYGDKSAQWLSDQTHSETPWQMARVGMSDTERGDKEITLESMMEYYSSLS
jgi:uncharacterized phage-associated protein